MSASPVLAVVLSAARLAGMAARKMKRTRVFDSVAGYMPQKQSRHHAIYRQGEKGLALNNLFLGIHIWHEQMWVLSFIHVFWKIQTVLNESVEFFIKIY